MRALIRLLVTLCLAWGFVACGGDDDDSSSASAKDDVQSAEEFGDAAASAADFAGFDGGCQAAVAAMASVAAGAGAALTGGSDLEDSLATFKEFADKAPEEIKDEMNTLADAYGEFVAVLADSDYDPASGEDPPSEVMAALESIATEDVSAAGDKVSAYFEDNCGVGSNG